jgi:hypothetical protein
MLGREHKMMMQVDQAECTQQTIHNDIAQYEMIDTTSSRFMTEEKIGGKRFHQTDDLCDFTEPAPPKRATTDGIADLSSLSLKDRLKAMQGPRLEFFDDSIQACILSYLTANEIVRSIGKTNIRYYSLVVPKVMKENERLSLSIPKVEKINKANKSIEDLLTWNREVQAILKSCSFYLTELDLSCADFKIFNPLNEKLINFQSFSQLRKYTCGVFEEDKFPKTLSATSVLHTPTLSEVCFRFIKMTTSVAEVMIRYFRQTTGNMEFKRGVNLRRLRFEYEDRERECILSLLSGVLHQNPYLEAFELISTSAYSFINVNNYLENFEDVVLGRSLKKLTLRDSLRYTERTRFAEEGT